VPFLLVVGVLDVENDAAVGPVELRAVKPGGTCCAEFLTSPMVCADFAAATFFATRMTGHSASLTLSRLLKLSWQPAPKHTTAAGGAVAKGATGLDAPQPPPRTRTTTIVDSVIENVDGNTALCNARTLACPRPAAF
jgi:hypothetical protein